MRRSVWMVATVVAAVALAVPARGSVVAHWSFGEGDGSTANSSVGGYAGTLVNFPDTGAGTGDTPWTAGWSSDGRLNFSSMSGQRGGARVETDFPLDSLIGTSFTVELTGTHNDAGQSWSPAIGQSGGCRFLLGKQSGAEQLHYNFDGIGSRSGSTTTLADGGMHHYAAVFDDVADEVRLYVEYRQVGTQTGRTGTLTDRGTLWLGRVAHNPGNEYWNGYVSFMRITGGALEPEEFHVIPEPATLALVGLGGLAAWARRRRRR